MYTGESEHAEKFVKNLLTKDALETPCESVKLEEITLKLPEWFDKDKYNRGRRFILDHCYSFTIAIAMGISVSLAIPSIVRVTVGTSRSSTPYTAYQRYAVSLLHVLQWFEHELEPESLSWRSLEEVRRRHLRASLGGKLKGSGIVSQRDLALAQFGFMGISVLKPDCLGIKQLRPGDWEAYNHFWRVLGHMVGIEDRYNICHETFDETHKVCKILLDSAFTPYMEIVPEYYEYMARTALDGPLTVIPVWDTESMLYYCRTLLNVPGYICTETDRVDLQCRLKEHLKGQSENSGVDSTSIIERNVDGVTRYRKRLLHVRDYDTLETAPEYQALPRLSRWRLHCCLFVFYIYSTYFGRILVNFLFYSLVFIIKYFPFHAFLRFGVRQSFLNPFVDTPVDYNTNPKTNAQFYDEYLSSHNKSRK